MTEPVDENEKLSAAYRTCFSGPDGDLVISDLSRFCRAYETTYDDIHGRQSLKEGRREVFLRIFQMAKLDHDELIRLLKLRTQGK